MIEILEEKSKFAPGSTIKCNGRSLRSGPTNGIDTVSIKIDMHENNTVV